MLKTTIKQFNLSEKKKNKKTENKRNVQGYCQNKRKQNDKTKVI